MDARLALSLVAAVAAGSLVSCGSTSQPAAACGSVDTLTAAVAALDASSLTSPAGASALDQVSTDLDAVKADAGSQFATQTVAVDGAYSRLQASTAMAKARPTPASLAATAKDFSTFRASVKTLTADVKSTC